MVRLKVQAAPSRRPGGPISIPYGTIKSARIHEQHFVIFNFNSTWYD